MSPNNKASFSNDEKAAIKDRARELAAEARSNKDRAQGEKDVLEAIAKLSEPDQTIAKRLHTLIKENVPTLASKTWYGFPAYTKDNKIICFFQYADKFKSRYATLGFSDNANLDDGQMWPVAFAITKMTSQEEAKIIELIKKAIN